MTLAQAIQSNRPFKRPHFPTWVSPTSSVVRYKVEPSRNGYSNKYATKEDMLATDWITQDPTPAVIVHHCCRCGGHE